MSAAANPYGGTDVWGDEAGRRWLDNEAALDLALRPFGEAALKLAGAGPGERALDVGCGTGATTAALGRRVVPGGSVLGIDICAPLLLRARQRTAGQRGVTFVHADAQTARLPRDRDLVFSRFGVMFFVEPVAAFRNLVSSLRSGGSLTFVCWRRFEDNPWQHLPFMAAREAIPDAALPPGDGPGPYMFGDRATIHRVMNAAGLVDLTIEKIDHHVCLGRDLSAAVHFAMTTGPTGRALSGASVAVRARAAGRIAAKLAPRLGAGGVLHVASAWLVNGFVAQAGRR